jgi:uncharacterized membrane protein YvbJ
MQGDFMEYCPKCGNKVDDTMTFCPKCGAPLKAGTSSQGPTTTPTTPYEYRYRHRHEKEEKNEKAEKNEKSEGGGHIGLLIAGLVVIFIGLLAYLATTNILTGPIASALVLVAIGIIILFAGIYFLMRTRSRNPVPT